MNINKFTKNLRSFAQPAYNAIKYGNRNSARTPFACFASTRNRLGSRILTA